MNNFAYTGQHLTETFEGCRLSAYQDIRGIWTIGYGHTAGVRQGDTCTQDQAETWLLQDIQWAAHVVNSTVLPPLTQGEFDALVDFVYNVGSGNFANSTMLRLLNAGEYAAAADEFEKWDLSAGKVSAGLLRRRQAEEAVFRGQA